VGALGCRIKPDATAINHRASRSTHPLLPREVLVNADLLTQYDAARATLDSLAVFADLDRGTIESRLSRDIADMRSRGVDTLFPRWIRRPLDAVTAFEEAHGQVVAALDQVREELALVEQQLASLRAEGRHAELEAYSRRAARLLCHEADLHGRLMSVSGGLIANARRGIARVLEVSLRGMARATARLANESLKGSPAMASSALAHVENYNRLATQAREVTGGLDIPTFQLEDVARLRRAAVQARRSSSASRRAASA
jgi:hypothetical protein